MAHTISLGAANRLRLLPDRRFVDLVPGERVVQAVDFESDDAAFHGTMTMTWRVTPAGSGTRVDFIAEHVPEGISAEEHAEGLTASLANLARYLEREHYWGYTSDRWHLAFDQEGDLPAQLSGLARTLPDELS